MNHRACHNLLLFGGSFDPPHIAHQMLPMLAMEAIGADGLAYIPAALSPHKIDAPPTDAHHRLAMLRLMLDAMPFATVLTHELDRHRAKPAEPTYTVDTLMQLREELGPQVKLRLLMGADQLNAFDRWRQPQRIVELAEPVVMVRPPMTRESMLATLPKGMDAKEWSGRLVDLPVMDVSATAIRRRVAEGKPICGFVAPAVAQYIRDNGLYRAG